MSAATSPAGVCTPGATVTERTPAQMAAHAAENRITEAEAAARLAAAVSIGRIVTAAEVADVVAFLASPRSVAINGDVIAAGGGAARRHSLLTPGRLVSPGRARGCPG